MKAVGSEQHGEPLGKQLLHQRGLALARSLGSVLFSSPLDSSPRYRDFQGTVFFCSAFQGYFVYCSKKEISENGRGSFTQSRGLDLPRQPGATFLSLPISSHCEELSFSSCAGVRP